MKTRSSYIAVAVIMMVALGAGIAFAERPCFSMITNLPGLELTSDQKAKLEKKKTEHCKNMIRLRADLSIAKLEKNKMISNKNFKEDAVRKQVGNIVDVKRDIQMARLDALTELRDVLNDEQWVEFSSYIGNKCGRSCFKKSSDCGRQLRGKHHRGGHQGRDFDCSMGYGRNMADCPNPCSRMRVEN